MQKPFHRLIPQREPCRRAIHVKGFLYLLLSLTLLSCTRGDGNPSEQAGQIPSLVPEVIVEEISLGPIYKTYTSVGNVAASDIARVMPKVSGRIKTMDVEEGDRVEPGRQLMLIDPFDYKQAVANTTALTNQAAATLRQAKRDLLRMEALYLQKSVSEQTYQDTVTAHDLALYRYDQAVVSRDSAQRNLKECTVPAPIPGFVTKKEVNEGELVTPATLAFVIMKMDMVKVEVDLPEEVYRSLAEESSAFITLDALPDRSFTGTITKIYPTIDPVSRTCRITISLENPGLLLRDGMTARSTVIQKARSNAISVPKTAVIQGEQGYFIYVIDAGKVKKTPVVLGIEGDKTFEVIQGARSGDKVVTKGLAGLRDGMNVRISGH